MLSTKVLFLSLFVYLTTMILLFRYDPSGHFALGNATSVAMVFFGIGVLYLLIIMSVKNYDLFNFVGLNGRNLWSIAKMSFIIISAVALFVGLIFLLFNFVQNPPQSKAFFSVLNVIIFTTTILLLIYLIKDYKFTNPYIRLIQSVILYIPCLFYDFVDWVKYQLSITTPTAYIILGIDIFFIALNYFWNKLKLYMKHNARADGLLLEGPVYLNKRHILGTFEDMKETLGNKNFSYNYGISFEIYINPQPPNTSAAYNEYTTLFDYGGKPKLLYKAKDNKLKIQVKMNDTETKNIYLGNDMKFQKWNKFLINYAGGTLDVFLNDNLISSTGSLAPYMTLDVVSVGKNNGINGGIKDVMYFRQPIV
jgi:hypothetical protein